MRAAVVGAGVLGLAAATELAEQGLAVTLYERNPGLGGNASWLAGGMLAPFCEGESAPESVVERGQTRAGLVGAPCPRRRAQRHPGRGAAARRGRSRAFRGAHPEGRRVDEAAIAALEPDLAGRFRKGLFFAAEGHLDPRRAMAALRETLVAGGLGADLDDSACPYEPAGQG